MLAEADRNATAALTAVEPAWTAMRTAADALGLQTRTLLHCGPPADPAHALVQPILNSAAGDDSHLRNVAAHVYLVDALDTRRGDDTFFPKSRPNPRDTPLAVGISGSCTILRKTRERHRCPDRSVLEPTWQARPDDRTIVDLYGCRRMEGTPPAEHRRGAAATMLDIDTHRYRPSTLRNIYDLTRQHPLPRPDRTTIRRLHPRPDTSFTWTRYGLRRWCHDGLRPGCHHRRRRR